MLDFDNIIKVERDAHYQIVRHNIAASFTRQQQAFANVEHCQTCGGYLGDVSARYAKHNDACNCEDRCHNCGEVLGTYSVRYEGHDVCTFCYSDRKTDMEADR